MPAAVAPVPDVLLGPVAALAGAIITIGFLARLLLEYIAYLRETARTALEGWRAQVEATNRIADVLEAERKERELRRRITDEAKG